MFYFYLYSVTSMLSTSSGHATLLDLVTAGNQISTTSGCVMIGNLAYFSGPTEADALTCPGGQRHAEVPLSSFIHSFIIFQSP